MRVQAFCPFCIDPLSPRTGEDIGHKLRKTSLLASLLKSPFPFTESHSKLTVMSTYLFLEEINGKSSPRQLSLSLCLCSNQDSRVGELMCKV